MRRSAEYDARHDPDEADDGDEERDEHDDADGPSNRGHHERDDDAPDLSLIPELLVANALVVRHSKSAEPSSTQTPASTAASQTPIERRQTQSPAQSPTALPQTPPAQATPTQAAPAPTAGPQSPLQTAAPQTKPATPSAGDETLVLPRPPAWWETGAAEAPDDFRAAPANSTQVPSQRPVPARAPTPLPEQLTSKSAANGKVAHADPFWANRTQALPLGPDSDAAAAARGKLSRADPSWSDRTQVLPPLSESDLPGAAQGKPPQVDPSSWANRTQALPPGPDSDAAATARGKLSQADPAWSDRTQVLPPLSESDLPGAAQGKPPQVDPSSWANRTQALPPGSDSDPVATVRGKLSQVDPSSWANRTQALPPEPATPSVRVARAQSAHPEPSWIRAAAAQRQSDAQGSRAPQQLSAQRVGAAQANNPIQSSDTSPRRGAPPPKDAPRLSDASQTRDATHSRDETQPTYATQSRDVFQPRSAPQPTNAPPSKGAPPAQDTAQPRDGTQPSRTPDTARWPPAPQENQPSPADPARHAGIAPQTIAAQPNRANTAPQATPPAQAAFSASAQHPRAQTPEHYPPLAAAGIGSIGLSMSTERTLWGDLQLEAIPKVMRLEPIRRRRWPMVLLGALTGIAIAVFYWLPRYAPQGLPLDLAAISRAAQSLAPTHPSAPATVADVADAKLQTERAGFDQRLAALEARGAGVWGGPEFAMAKMRAAESIGAHDGGNTQIALDRLADASRLLDAVESKAPQALAAELAAGQKALAAGQEEIASQAFDLAARIDPKDKRIAEGQRHTRNLSGVLPLIADAQNAESARNYSRAIQDYSQALSLDPGNDKARAGLARANAAFNEDNYAKSVGSGFAALGAGRLDDARAAFEKARALRPNGTEAAEGLRRVEGALSAKGYSALHQRAAGLEAQERWDEAAQLYESALQADPSLAFAQQGKDRAAARAQLGAAMQALIDRPERLSSASVREQARSLLETANQQTTSGPVLRSQIARLELLLPDYEKAARTDTTSVATRTDSAWRSDSGQSDTSVPAIRADSARLDPVRSNPDKPVRLSLLSDNATAVAIPSIGQFGTFARRDIELKPGRYTVIGTRDGYRDVRRDITVSPGQDNQTINVSCSDPI